MSVPKSKWEWYGLAAHFCGDAHCLYHLTTKVGNYIVSTVGDYYPKGVWDGNKRRKPETIGLDRLYETFVFKAGAPCDCGCGEARIDGASEIDSLSANDGATARSNHMNLCEKWSKK